MQQQAEQQAETQGGKAWLRGEVGHPRCLLWGGKLQAFPAAGDSGPGPGRTFPGLPSPLGSRPASLPGVFLAAHRNTCSPKPRAALGHLSRCLLRGGSEPGHRGPTCTLVPPHRPAGGLRRPPPCFASSQQPHEGGGAPVPPDTEALSTEVAGKHTARRCYSVCTRRHCQHLRASPGHQNLFILMKERHPPQTCGPQRQLCESDPDTVKTAS